jgi:hypothetical protein
MNPRAAPRWLPHSKNETMPRTAALALCLALIAQTATAQGAAAPALGRAALAAGLYHLGLTQGDALLVLTAARLRREAGLPDHTADGGSVTLLTWQEMLTTARQLAGDDPTLLALVGDAEAERDKGVRVGPAYVIARIAPGLGPDTLDYPFKRRRGRRCLCRRGGRHQPDLYVHDEAGRLICTDTDPSNIAYCNWTPRQDAIFTVTVENRGGRRNRVFPDHQLRTERCSGHSC